MVEQDRKEEAERCVVFTVVNYNDGVASPLRVSYSNQYDNIKSSMEIDLVVFVRVLG